MQGKDGAFLSKAAQEMTALRRLQSDLEGETGNACFLGLSVAATIQQCLRLDNARAATRVKSDFKVSDRHFALLKVSPTLCCAMPCCALRLGNISLRVKPETTIAECLKVAQ